MSRNTQTAVEMDAALVGKRIAALRKERGFTQVELSERLGVSQAAISEYERGDSRLALPTLVRLCQILRVSTDEILGFKGSERKQPTHGRLWNRLRKVEELPEMDRQTVVRVIDDLLAKQNGGA